MSIASRGGKAKQSEPEVTASKSRVSVRTLFSVETNNYFFLLGIVLILISIGVVMVFSSSSVRNFSNGGNSFSGLISQSIFVVIGLPVMLIMSRMPKDFWRKWAVILVIAVASLQLVVIGSVDNSTTVGGNRNWINFGGITFQPSEFLKVALALWLATAFTKSQIKLDNWRTLIGPIVLIPLGTIGLVMLGGDLGTVIVLVMLVFGAAYFAGVRMKYLVTAAAVAIAGVIALAFTASSRIERIMTFFAEGCLDYEDACWQVIHASYALSAGGIFGVGLGNSKAKWNWLPTAENDFIFAIIGEELGLLGAIFLLLLFVLLAIALFRIITANQNDRFVRVFTGAVLVWLIGQAFINIAVVLQLLPVLGVPMPFVSAGGSSLLATMGAIGVILSFTRSNPVDEYKRAGK